MPERTLSIVVMGTGPFAVPSFEAIRQSGDQIRLVVTRPEIAGKSRKPAPPSPVRQWAMEHDLPIFDPSSINEPGAISRVQSESPDLLVVCDYGQILSTDALSTAPLGGINLHGSLLPKYRGAAPVQWAVWNGDQTSGVSVIHMTPRLDGGPVIARSETPIGTEETAGQLEERLSQIGVASTLDSINLLRTWDGQSQLGEVQDKSLVSKAPRLKKADGRINWSHSSREIDCHIRAMQPWPGAFAEADIGAKQPLRLSIVKATPQPMDKSGEIGQVVLDDDAMSVNCADGRIIIERLIPAGKREMAIADFLRGRPLTDGQKLA